jgi:hypothetical protein
LTDNTSPDCSISFAGDILNLNGYNGVGMSSPAYGSVSIGIGGITINTIGNGYNINLDSPIANNSYSVTIAPNNGLKLSDYSTIASPVEGQIAYNFSTHLLTTFNGTTWI